MKALEPYIYRTLLHRYQQAYKRLLKSDLSNDELVALNDVLLDIEESLVRAYKEYRKHLTINPNKKRI